MWRNKKRRLRYQQKATFLDLEPVARFMGRFPAMGG
jgi:hypothetical protein